MKKIYFFSVLMGLASFSIGQKRISTSQAVNVLPLEISSSNGAVSRNASDTLTLHLDFNSSTPTLIRSGTAGDGGFVGGSNSYGDIAKAQKFDATYGVTGAGTISELLFWFGGKEGTGAQSFTPTIWADNNGIPGAVLATGTPFTHADMDTNQLAAQPIGTRAAYNVSAAFPTGALIPMDEIFWAGFTFNHIVGTYAGVWTSSDGDFTDAVTNTFELWGPLPGDWMPFNDGTANTWGIDVALAIYPVVEFLPVGIKNNNGLASHGVRPNPAMDKITVMFSLPSTSNVTLEITDINGRIVETLSVANVSSTQSIEVNTSNYNNGIYFYSVKTNTEKINGKFAVAN
ncbi:MAG: T9SS type A sorting domain-containing protein [Bacteroidetes bacterium]|nr:T9SS type A sorting domain-containing protein [Bacteroidota bacterium]HET6242913.1 T9SS type A sorting domain-containing protein [Bacteroidia bacterium]